jgi:hypothetical protein
MLMSAKQFRIDYLHALVQLLYELEVGDKAKRAVEARSLLIAVDSRFVLMLAFMCDIFGRTKSLSLMLQSSTIDFCAAIVSTYWMLFVLLYLK